MATIVRILSNEIFDFSTNKFLNIVENNWITLYPIEEFIKYLISLKELNIYLGIAQNCSLFVQNSRTIRINCINQLIENNNKGIVRIWLNEIQVNQEIIEKITI
jgi:hypothetical protein